MTEYTGHWWWNVTDRENLKYTQITVCPSATLYTTNPTWSDLRLTQGSGLRGSRLIPEPWHGQWCILYNQRDATCTMFFIIISALHVSGGFSAHHQELIKLYWLLGIAKLSCCLPVVESRKAWQYPRLHIQFYTLLMMGGKTARNM